MASTTSFRTIPRIQRTLLARPSSSFSRRPTLSLPSSFLSQGSRHLSSSGHPFSDSSFDQQRETASKLRASNVSGNTREDGRKAGRTAREAAGKQKWSTALLISLATMVGSSTYLIGVYSSKTKDSQSQYEPPTKKGFTNALNELKQVFPEEAISTNEETLKSMSGSNWTHHVVESTHGVAIFPKSTEDVVRVVKIASKNHIPITPFGGGTSLEGHFDAPSSTVPNLPNDHGQHQHPAYSISISFESMDKIIAVHPEDGDVVVQPGLGYQDLNETLKRAGTGLFFAVDPGPGATIGGMVATGCSGTNAVRYGTMRDNVLNLTVVLPNGEVIKTRQRAKKSAAGPDLGKLFVGSEGTLGIVTEATLKLNPILPYSVGVCSFPTVQQAADAVAAIVRKGIQVQCLELLDDIMIKAVNHANSGNSGVRQWEALPTLFIKFAGADAQIKADIDEVGKITKASKGNKFIFAKSEQEKEDIWEARKIALFSAIQWIPNSRSWVTDVCVPISRLPNLVQETRDDLEQSGLIGPIVGHAGDGNFHALIAVRDHDELEKAKGAVHRMVERALRMEGTCTGEHGVGVGKREYLERELGPGTLQLLRRLKTTLDPLNIMNPGKLIPDESDVTKD